MDWLAPHEARIGLGCMRLTGDGVGEAAAEATIAAALAGGVTVFDTAHAYGPGPGPRGDRRGEGERLLARTLLGLGAAGTARVVTKGGMRRDGGGWQPDGRAGSIELDCEASLAALSGLPIDLYLLHAPDPRVPFATSLRALRALVDDGRVRRVGLSNVNRKQLRQALDLVPVAAIEVSLPLALRQGVMELAAEHGLWVLGHAPLGGPKKAPRWATHPVVAPIAARHGCSAAAVVLAWGLSQGARTVVLPGASRPASVVDALTAARVQLDDAERALLEERALRVSVPRPMVAMSGDGAPAATDGEVVIIAGLSGSGKSTWARGLVDAGHLRLNRDDRGGSMAKLHRALDEALASGARRVVLDNTYLLRAQRREVVEIAARHGLRARCLFIETPMAEAQRNVIWRMLEAHGRLLGPEELGGKDDPSRLAPTALFRQARTLEPVEDGEGFASVERVPFSRHAAGLAPSDAPPQRGCAIAAEVLASSALAEADLDALAGPRLVFSWGPPTLAEEQAARIGAEAASCPHGAGPPVCWCRPPLPGLLLAFAHRHGLDPRALVVVGHSSAHRAMALSVGARFVPVATRPPPPR